MDLCIQSCSSVCLWSCITKTLSLDAWLQFFSQSFMPDMLIYTRLMSTILPIQVALTLAEGHKMSKKQNLFVSDSLFFVVVVTDQSEIWCVESVQVKHYG